MDENINKGKSIVLWPAVDLSINLRFPELMNHYFIEADRAGLSNSELGALIKIFRAKS